MLAVVSRLPKEIVDSMEAQSRDAEALKKAADKTGIVKRLEKAKESRPRASGWTRPFSYYALSPRWTDDTKKSVVFWLNPMDQENNSSGWFTVQDLDDWIAGKGKIPKTKVLA